MQRRWRIVAVGGLTIAVCLAFTPITPAEPVVQARPVPTQLISPAPVDLDAIRINERIAALSLDQKIAQLMMVHCPGVDPATVAGCAATTGAAGVILMGDNIGPTPADVAALTAALPNDKVFPLLVAIDEEGGDIVRLPWDTLPGGSALAAAPAAETETAFAARAALLHEVGVNLNFGIVADVTDDPKSFLASRVLGTDPAGAAERVAAAVRGEAGTVASTLKHFPGHGAAPGNSHTSIPVSPLDRAAWEQSAALPFIAGIQAGAGAVMMSHIVTPAIDSAPASLSPAWHRILRDDLGFSGVIVSDDLLMLQRNGLAEFADPSSNAIRALSAGTDLLLWVLPADPASVGVDLGVIRAAIAGAVADGRLSQKQIDESLKRVLRLRLNSH